MALTRDNQFNELQSVRGWMVVLLAIAHAWTRYGKPDWFHTLEQLNNGHARVVAFFVLSGYVVTKGLDKNALNKANVLAFYAKRFFRLYPAMILASFLGLAYVLLLHNKFPVADTSGWFATRFQPERTNALWIGLSFLGLASFLLPPLWTLTIEIFASAAMPGIALLLRAPRRWYVAVTATTILFALTLGPKTPYYVGIYIPAFMFGAGISILPESFTARIQGLGNWRWAIFIAALVVCFCVRVVLGTDYHDRYEALVEAFAAAVMFTMIIKSGLDFAFLRNRFTVFLGDISYSIYLLHFPVLCILAMGMELTPLGALGAVPKLFILAALTVIATIPLAWVSYRVAELPGMAMGRSVGGWVRNYFSTSTAKSANPKPA